MQHWVKQARCQRQISQKTTLAKRWNWFGRVSKVQEKLSGQIETCQGPSRSPWQKHQARTGHGRLSFFMAPPSMFVLSRSARRIVDEMPWFGTARALVKKA